MQQVVQEIRNGKLSVAQIPAPLAQPGEVLIANAASVISAGTERMVIDLRESRFWERPVSGPTWCGG